jgi:hypothetical protein
MITRREAHNSHFDHELVSAGRCGNVHLASGARCRRPALHRGGCEFLAPTVTLRNPWWRAGASPGPDEEQETTGA